jgi:hypothetical protein
MNTPNKLRITALSVAVAMICSVAQSQTPTVESKTPTNTKGDAQYHDAQYAEELYRDIRRFSKGAVDFKLRTVAVGRLSLPGKNFAEDLVGFRSGTTRIDLVDINSTIKGSIAKWLA